MSGSSSGADRNASTSVDSSLAHLVARAAEGMSSGRPTDPEKPVADDLAHAERLRSLISVMFPEIVPFTSALALRPWRAYHNESTQTVQS